MHEEQHQEHHQEQPLEHHEELHQETKTTVKTQEKPQRKVVEPRAPPPEEAIIIDFEVCVNCHEHHWCTQHVEAKYTDLFLAIQQAVEQEIPGTYCTYNLTKPKTGAFEIRHNGVIIFSKLKCQLFPQVVPVVARIKQFLEDVKNKADLSVYANKKEQKYNPPRQIKERPTFQTYMKQREEEERRIKAEREEKARIKAEQEELARLEQLRIEEEQRIQREKEEEEQRQRDEQEKLRLQQLAEEEAAKQKQLEQEEADKKYLEEQQQEQPQQEQEVQA